MVFGLLVLNVGFVGVLIVNSIGYSTELLALKLLDRDNAVFLRLRQSLLLLGFLGGRPNALRFTLTQHGLRRAFNPN